MNGVMKECRERPQPTITKFCLIRYDKLIIKYSIVIINEITYNLLKIHEHLKKY